MKVEDSLGFKYPHLLAEWDFEKNINYNPFQLEATSTVEVWWKCKNRHTWKAHVNLRAKGLMSCQTCKSFVYLDPILMKDWDFNLNDVNPENIKIQSARDIHWKCHSCNHRWVDSVKNRGIVDKRKCPKCGERLLLPTSSIVHESRMLLSMWNYALNKCSPLEVSKYDSKNEYYWKCEKEHIIKETPYKMLHGCKTCFNEMKLMINLFPESASLWDYEKNIGFDINKIPYDDGNSYYWKCEHSHSWKNSPYNIFVNKMDCPFCLEEKTNEMFKILMKKDKVYVEKTERGWTLAKGVFLNENEYEKGTPSYFYDNLPKRNIFAIWDTLANGMECDSDKIKDRGKYFYFCENGHHFHSRTSKLLMCDKCHEDISSFKNRYPHLMKYVNHPSNEGINIGALNWYSNVEVTWTCPKHSHHIWKAKLSDAVWNGMLDCPYCKHEIPIHGNTLDVTHPEATIHWDYEKNSEENVFIDKVTYKYSHSVWWLDHGKVSKKMKIETFLKSIGLE